KEKTLNKITDPSPHPKRYTSDDQLLAFLESLQLCPVVPERMKFAGSQRLSAHNQSLSLIGDISDKLDPRPVRLKVALDQIRHGCHRVVIRIGGDTERARLTLGFISSRQHRFVQLLMVSGIRGICVVWNSVRVQ